MCDISNVFCPDFFFRYAWRNPRSSLHLVSLNLKIRRRKQVEGEEEKFLFDVD